MGDLGLFLLIAGVPGFIILVLILRSASRHLTRKRIRHHLQFLQRTAGGKLGEMGVSGNPALLFDRGGRRWLLDFSFRTQSAYPMARVTVDLAGESPGSFHIVPEGAGQLFLKMFGAEDLTVGDPSFDADYVVRARPPSLAAMVFALHRREQAVEAVRRLAHIERPTIDVDRRALTIRSRHLVADVDELNRLIQTADEFLSFLFDAPVQRESNPAGVEIEELAVAAGGECPVCGAAMSREAVRCELCRTPHHAECWRYMGQCSTYACSGRRFVSK